MGVFGEFDLEGDRLDYSQKLDATDLLDEIGGRRWVRGDDGVMHCFQFTGWGKRGLGATALCGTQKKVFISRDAYKHPVDKDCCLRCIRMSCNPEYAIKED